MNAKRGTRVALYARVSTTEQSSDNQLRELRDVAKRAGWTITAEFTDNGISGAKGRQERPGLDALMQAANRREFDMVAVWALDRAFRSVADAANCMTDWKKLGIDYYDHTHQIDTSTPGGEMAFHMMAAVAQFERSMIQARVKAGLDRARAEGRVGGRPQVAQSKEKRIRRMLEEGAGIKQIARTVKVGISVVYRVKQEMAAEG
jgi:DNA invertase Pin-like site-specific DNA recombinase